MQKVNAGALWQECVWDGYLVWPRERGGEPGGQGGGKLVEQATVNRRLPLSQCQEYGGLHQ